MTEPISNPIPIPVRSAGRGTAEKESTGLNLQSQNLVHQFELAVEKSNSIDQLLKSLALIISQQINCLGLWIAQRGEGDFSSIHSVTDDAETVWDLHGETIQKLVTAAVETEKIQATRDATERNQLIASPIRVDEQIDFVFSGSFSLTNQTSVRQQWLMGMASMAFLNWCQKHQIEQFDIQKKSLNDAITLVQSLDQTKTVRESAMVVANHLRQMCSAEQVAVSYGKTHRLAKLVAVSDVEQVNLGSESNIVLQSTCNQTLILEKTLAYPNSEDENTADLLPLKQFCRDTNTEACVNLPLKTIDGDVLGAVLISTTEQRVNQPGFIDYLERVTSLVSGHLSTVLRANEGIRGRAVSRLQGLKDRKWTKQLLIGSALVVATLCVPMPYRVGCDCELQPVLRRYVAAPYQGILEKTLSDNGDVVKQGQILAQMDGRQLRMEFAGLKADLNAARKRRDSALAQGDVAKSQIARSEMKRLESEISIYEQRMVNLEIRSPIDGIIVSGDLEKVEGAPLEMGQTLFEVGPLDNMLAQIAIPESEIQFVEPGMPVAIKLNAFPLKKWHGKIQRIHPSSEVINDETVFVAEVELPNELKKLKPGLKGSAKIKANSYPIGWNYFHKAWESVRYWLIW